MWQTLSTSESAIRKNYCEIMSTFAEKAIKYYTNLNTPTGLPPQIDIANPYESDDVRAAVKKFFKNILMIIIAGYLLLELTREGLAGD